MRGMGRAGAVVPDERQAYIGAEGDHGGVAPHARVASGLPVGGVPFDQAAAGTPEAFSDRVGAARAGPGNQQRVAVVPVLAQRVNNDLLIRPGAGPGDQDTMKSAARPGRSREP